MAQIEIPKKLPLLLIQNDILLPGSSLRIPLSGSSSMNMVKSRLLSRNTLANSIVGIVTVEDISDFEKTIIDSKCKVIGTAAFVLQVGCSNWPKSNGYVLSTVGVCRFSLDKLVMEEPYPMGVVTQLDYIYPNKDTALSAECIKMAQKIQKLASTLLERLSFPAAQDMQKTVQNACYSSLPDIVVPLLLPSYEEKKEILYALDIEDRLKKAMVIIRKYTSDIKHMKKGDVPKTELFVISPKDQKLLQIRSKTGDNFFDVSDSVNEIDELQNKIVKANLPVEVNKVVVRDLHRLKKMGPFSPEHSIIRNYIEFVVELPWSTSSSETIDIHKARKDLDCEHYGMDKVKQRVLEYLAVRQLKSSARGPILCFVGPPGVGKTSIGRSIAHTLGRQFQRISLGGVSNQSDIRGHRRTYIGAMPGRIIQALKNAGVNNPVILLDEIDKMTSGVHGDPAAALLEVLDPLQNNHFIDHYLNVPFDLSQVTFIATANQVKTIPAPLLDRMETITVCGYTVEEKVYIAQQHLLPKQLTENGLDSSIMTISANSLKQLIGSYTSEAGVRNLERKLGALCRAVAVRVAEKDTEPASVLSLPVDITPDTLETILGVTQLVSDCLQSDVPTSIDPDPDSGDEEELLDFDSSDITDPDSESSDESNESQNFDESFDGGFKHSSVFQPSCSVGRLGSPVVSGGPVTGRPTTNTPMTDQPTTSTPVNDRPTTRTPMSDMPTISTPESDRPTISTLMNDRPSMSIGPSGDGSSITGRFLGNGVSLSGGSVEHR
ncbi:hypothetical protein J6590_011846 [Homalodisca vitripennis]|nr:hypothetical protein J6590_011846 [Homalodisca vitripennis]